MKKKLLTTATKTANILTTLLTLSSSYVQSIIINVALGLLITMSTSSPFVSGGKFAW